MKTIKTLMFVTIAAMGFNSCAQESVLQNNEIPGKIKSYITSHFPNEAITLATKDQEAFKTKYEIILNNATELEFNGGKEITNIDGKTKLPDSTIPVQILSYVNINYPSNFIKSWQLNKGIQEIVLDNGLDFKFNMNNIFLSIDN